MESQSSEEHQPINNSIRISTPYDAIPYPASAYSQSHPDRLATLAALFGLNPPDIRSCRVLELGCADGSNLIPMACAMPESTFIGIDSSELQVKSGKDAIAALALSNIHIYHLDIQEIGASFGFFDYIIAHGVFSWVPPEVQGKMLSVCRDNLSENGVAYISYNTNPGWRMRGMLRDMMLYHSDKFDDPLLQIEQARALIQWLSEAVSIQNNPYGMLLQSELENMRNWPDTYFRHDSLAEFNTPVYFYEFIGQARQYGLKYLAEAEFQMMLCGNYSSAIYETLERLSRDIIEMEQYMDFLRNRMFRQTLLCHENVLLRRDIGHWSLEKFDFAALITPNSDNSVISDDNEVVYHSQNNRVLSTREPIVKAAFKLLTEIWPATMPFDALLKKAQNLISANTQPADERAADIEVNRKTLGESLLACLTQGMCEIHLHPLNFTLSSGERPEACPWVRQQASKGQIVTNRRHERVGLDTFEKQILPLLDGKNDYQHLITKLTDMALYGVLFVEVDGKKIEEEQKLKDIMATSLKEKMRQFERRALLIG